MWESQASITLQQHDLDILLELALNFMGTAYGV